MHDPKRNRPAVGSGTAPKSKAGRPDTEKGTPKPAADRFRFRAEVLAEVALTTGKPAVDESERLIAVPDLVRAEAAANGLPDVATVVLERADGRSVAIYRLPAEAGGRR